MNRYTFKAKRKDNGEWVYGNVIINPNSTDKVVIVESGVTSYSSTKEAILEFINDYVEVIPETLCQCTGLQDKDGNYVFENDIIDINQTVNGCNLFKIVWDKYKWNAEYYVKMVTPRLYEYDFEELILDGEIKIIGNKFDEVEE